MLTNSAKTVLFYSFKGGVGRTQLMLNSAKYLASQGRKILMVDFDIYAPGLSFWDIDSKPKDSNEDYLLNFMVKDFSGDATTNSIYLKKISENLFLAPIYDMQNIDIYHKLLVDLSAYLYDIKLKANDKISQQTKLSDAILESFINKLTQNYDFDYIFFDARTGLTEISDILFSSRIDLKLFISAYNHQNIRGINSVLKLINKDDKHTILRILSLKPSLENNKVLEQLKSEANLDDNKDLRENFNWYDMMEIQYNRDIVLNDFKLWEEIDTQSSYKLEVEEIANKIETIIHGDSSIEL